MKQSTAFDISLIRSAISEKNLKPLALFYKVKSMYYHSIIYNYTPNKLAKLTGLHHKTVKRYVQCLQNMGLIEHRDGNLHFKKVKGLKLWVETRPYTSYEGILQRIYFIYLINNKRQQTFRLAKDYGIKIEALSPRAKRKALKGEKTKIGLESSIKPVISVRGLSKLLNHSVSKSQKIIQKLKDNNYIKTRPHIKAISTSRPTKYSNYYYFNRNGYLFRYYGTEIQGGRYLTI